MLYISTTGEGSHKSMHPPLVALLSGSFWSTTLRVNLAVLLQPRGADSWSATFRYSEIWAPLPSRFPLGNIRMFLHKPKAQAGSSEASSCQA